MPSDPLKLLHIRVGADNRDQVDDIKRWCHIESTAEALRRSVRTTHALMQLYEQMAAEVGGENGRLLRRVAVDLGPEWLVNRQLSYIDEDATAHDGPGVQVGKHIFFEDERGVLHATKADGSIFRVEDGRLHRIAVIPATNGGIDQSLN